MGANWTDKKPTTSKVKIEPQPKFLRTPIVDEKYMEIEKRYCAFFGCGQTLSLTEGLCGDFCEKHFDYKKPVYFNGLL